MAMIEFRRLRKTFGSHSVLSGVDLAVERGEIMFIIGTSGVGKSVTIKHLVGLLRPDGGEILLDGRRVDNLSEREMYEVRRRCAMVFQHSTLLDSMTVLENVALPLMKHERLSPGAACERARAFLDQVHMAEFADLLPSALSDGMRKRVAIARALTMRPECVLFDEPTTGLDPVSARRVDALIKELSDTLHVTSIVVSHDLTSIFAIADRIALIYKGVVHALSTPAELRRSPDPVVQQFISGRAEGPMETPGF
jgi:phospholipid/cholesterol/gamma-HCH transport system ATP-binding protein